MTVHHPASRATLTKREWQEFPIGADGLGDAEANRLHAIAVHAAKQLRLPETAVLARSHRALRAQQVTGILSVPGRTLEILPKIDGEDGSARAALIRMLAVAHDLRVADGELAALDTQRHDLLELLIRLFTMRMLVAVRQGLPRRYLERADDLPVMRGRLNVKRQLTHLAVRPDLLACRFDELSDDTPLNRLLKAVVRRLMRVSRSQANIRMLAEVSSRFEMVGDSARPLAEPVLLDRTNAAFHDVYRLARLFLSGDWQTTGGGRTPGFALLFPMNDLFEKFIGHSLRRALAPTVVRLTGGRRHHALHGEAGGLFALRPDMVIETGSHPLIVDTKWKRLDPAAGEKLDVAQSDIYQMLTYAQAYDAHRLILLYPWHSRLGDSLLLRHWQIVGTSRWLDVACVDIGNTATVMQQLREIILCNRLTSSE